MMNGCKVRVDYSGDVARALELASEELAKLGYEKKKLDGRELEMSFAGKLLTTDPGKLRHFVKVVPASGGLSFAFGTGMVASHWTASDERWAQERANQIVAAIESRLDPKG